MSEIIKIDRTASESEPAPAVITLDKKLMVVEHTPAWLRYIDTKSDSVIGQHIYRLLPESERELQPLIQQAFRGKATTTKTLHIHVHDSSLYWDVTFEPRTNAEGKVIQLLMIAYAITDEKRLRQQLEQVVADRTRKLDALYGIASIASEVLNLNDALQRSLERVVATGLGSGAAIYLWDGATQTARAVAQLNVPQLNTESADNQMLQNQWLNTCITQKQPLMLDDIRHDERVSRAIRESDILSMAAVPMLPKGQSVGVLTVFRDSDRRFDANDIDLLGAVADQVGSIIQSFNLQRDHDRLLLQDERRRLADQLHDAVTQSLYSLTLYAGAIQQFADNDELEKSLPYIEPLRSTAQHALREMRLMLHNLRPSALAHDGLVEALRQRFNAVERRANMQGQVITETEIVLAPKVEEQLYYIINEALNNTLKHADATRVTVVMRQSADSLTVTIRDNGNGFDVTSGEKAGGLGLRSMRERAEKLSGTLTIEPTADGTTVQVYIPLSTALRSFDDKSISS